MFSKNTFYQQSPLNLRSSSKSPNRGLLDSMDHFKSGLRKKLNRKSNDIESKMKEFIDVQCKKGVKNT